MSKWQFEPMPLTEAQRILASRDFTLDLHADRIRAQHVAQRRYANDGWAPPPLRYFERCGHCQGTGYQNRLRCGMCRGKGYFESELPTPTPRR